MEDQTPYHSGGSSSHQQHHREKQPAQNQQSNNASLYYKKSQKISSRMFRELFEFNENDRNRKEMKRDYREMEQIHKGGVKFKHLIDYYLTSSEDFGRSLKDIDARHVLHAISLQLTDSELEEELNQDDGKDQANSENNDSQGGSDDQEEEESVEITHFNEKLVRVICLNQAIDKYQRELGVLKVERDAAVQHLLSRAKTEKLQILLQSAQAIPERSYGFAHSNQSQYGSSHLANGLTPGQEVDKNLQQIDIKLQNMLHFMNDFAVNFQTSLREAASLPQFRPSSASMFPRPQSSGYRSGAGLLTTQVWPKSRMLFAVVSKMSKEGLLNEAQRGVLKDMILDYDQRLLQCLQDYETGGDRDRLYFNFLQLANSGTSPNNS